MSGPLRILVAGQAVGQASDGLAQISFAQLILFDIGRGASPGRIAGVLAATLLPFSLVGPFAGVLIDRWDRRRTLVVTSWCRAGLAAAAVAVALGRSAPLAYAGVLLLLSSSRFVLAGKGAVLPRIVAPSDLVTANAVSSLAGMTAAFAGAVVGSTFVAAAAPAGFAGAAAGYLLAGLLLRRLPPVGGQRRAASSAPDAPTRASARAAGGSLRGVVADLRAGVRAVSRSPAVRRPLLAVWLHRFLLGTGFITLVLVADSGYHLQAAGYGLALAVTGLAAFVGTLAAPLLARRYAPRALLPLAFLPPAAAAVVAGYTPYLPGLLATVAVAAVSFQVLKVLADALVGGASADVVRGRVFAAYDVLYNVAFVVAGLAFVPLWHPGAARRLLWGLAAAFVLAWLALVAEGRRWPFGIGSATTVAGIRRPAGRSLPPTRWRRWAPRCAAVVAGGVPVLAFPRPSLWWWAWIGLLPWLLVLRHAGSPREGAVRGWCGGAGFLFAAHYWLLPNVGVFLVPVVAAVGALWAPWGAVAAAVLTRRSSPRRAAAALAVLPAGWVAIEAVRSWASLGGPWALLGASQWPHPVMLAPAAVGGVWLVSALVVVANVALLLAVSAGGGRGRLVGVAAVLLAAIAAPLCAAVLPVPPATGRLSVALVQPGVVPDPQARFDAGQTLTSSLVGRRVDLVVWGESSVGFDLAARPDLLERLRDVSARVGGDLLVNVDARGGDGGIRKTSVLVDPAGVRGQYTKTRLVPFGEYVPFRRVLGWLTLVSRAAPEDRGRGSQVTVLTAGKVRVGPLVCFESAFPDLARTAARRGADVIVYQTATSTFQGSWAPAQHASLAAVRAVETGRPVLQAALTGTSAAYAADGRRLAWFDTDRRGVVEVSLPLATRTTPYDRLGDWVPAVAFAGLVLSLLAAALRVARSSSADTPPPGGIVGNEASP